MKKIKGEEEKERVRRKGKVKKRWEREIEGKRE